MFRWLDGRDHRDIFWRSRLALAADQPGFMKAEFIYETAPFPSCHASTIAETKSGLITAWFGGTRERDPDVCIYVSRHENGQLDGAAGSRERPGLRRPTVADVESGFVPAEERAFDVVL
jgi:hypothetical protein